MQSIEKDDPSNVDPAAVERGTSPPLSVDLGSGFSMGKMGIFDPHEWLDCFGKHRQTSWWFQTHLKNISQIGSFPQEGVNIKNISNHQLNMGTLR